MKAIVASILASSSLALISLPAHAQAPDPWTAAKSSFEEKVQPVLFRNCTGCHTLGGHAGGLKLDSLETLLKGGDMGAVIVPGKPDASLLSKAVHYDSQPQMPPRGKIPAADI